MRKSLSLTLVWSEDAARPRGGTMSRGFQNLCQIERCHVNLSPDACQLPHRDNKHFTGTTSGTVFMNVPAPPEEAFWKMTVSQKKAFWGDARTSDPAEDSKAKYPPRSDTDVEPLNYWQMPKEVYEEILWRMQAKAVIDLTPSVDALPVACLEQSIMYLGLCFTEAGIDLFKRRLSSVIFSRFLDEASPLYKPQLAQTINAIKGGQGEGGPAPDRVPKPKGRTRKNNKALAAAKGAPAGGGGEDAAEDAPAASDAPVTDTAMSDAEEGLDL